MKRELFIMMWLGLLVNVALVSCDDKIIDNDFENSPEPEEEDSEEIYVTVQDSGFYYRDGKLSEVIRQYFDSDGKITRSLVLQYDADGNLTANEESSYTYSYYVPHVGYSDSENSVYVNNHGFRADTRSENKVIGVGDDYIRSSKQYIYLDGKWFLSSENDASRKNNLYKSKSVTYGMYNGKVVILSSSEYETAYNPLTGKESSSVNISYSVGRSYDINDPDRFVVQSINGEMWSKQTAEFDSDGRQLLNLIMESEDSINWVETGRREYKYDAKGNLLEEKQVRDYGFDIDNVYAYDSRNNLIKQECYRKYDSDDDYVLYQNVDFTYSTADKLMGMVVNSIINNVTLPLSVSTDASGKVQGVGVSLSYGSVGNSGSVICSVTCDSNGYPSKESLYMQDSTGNWKEFSKCTIEYDSKGNCLNYDVKTLEDGEWKETAIAQSTYGSNGNLMSQHLKSVTTSTYSNNYYSYTVTSESESITRREYNTLGYISYQFSSSTYRRYYDYSDGRVDDRNSDSRQEIFYSTIKVK